MGEILIQVLFMYGLAIVIAMISALMIKGIVGVLSMGKAKPAPAAAVAAPKPVADPAENDIAVIAAAVYAMLGAHRIVHIEAARSGPGWTAEGRLVHHASHRPSPRH